MEIRFSGTLAKEYARENALSLKSLKMMVEPFLALLDLDESIIEKVLIGYLPPDTLGYGDYKPDSKTVILGIDIWQSASKNLDQLRETIPHELTHAWQEKMGLEYDKPAGQYFLTSKAEYAALVVSGLYSVIARKRKEHILAQSGAVAPSGWQDYVPNCVRERLGEI